MEGSGKRRAGSSHDVLKKGETDVVSERRRGVFLFVRYCPRQVLHY